MGLPAMVDTVGSPEEGIVRVRIVFCSVTNMELAWVPDEGTKAKIPIGLLKMAFVPIPSRGIDPPGELVLPAIVVTVNVLVLNSLIRLFPASDMYRLLPVE